MGHLSLVALVRTNDLKSRDQHNAGQEHTDQPHCVGHQAGVTVLKQDKDICMWAKDSSQHSIGTMDSRAMPCKAGWYMNMPQH